MVVVLSLFYFGPKTFFFFFCEPKYYIFVEYKNFVVFQDIIYNNNNNNNENFKTKTWAHAVQILK